ncbi:diguanylate cyclase domain-containing protein [Caenimonas aquaedulcis]|uniref:Diguanylate cyclase n=1 Tax=Caenimonas aquaedulcis TaxID=2793270 RepID=A0A931MFZ2_9BURK|nr:diguanylate cyclase [Caenimonas aquaedulcis]MBG9387751.1 diguanylate cyclase [Caenimonas aquaedulcis]
MSMTELAIWCAAAGAIALVVILCLVDLAMVATLAAAQGAAYNLAALAFVLLLSGVPQAIFPAIRGPSLQVAQVLIGPLCVCLGNYWVRGWLAARERDRLMDMCLLGSAVFAPAAGLFALLALQPSQQLPAVAVVVLVNTGLVVWMSVRAWLFGDRLALGIAIGSVLMLPAVGGLYAVALGIPGIGAGWQAGVALFTVLCVAVIGMMLWKRNQHAQRSRGFEPVQSQYDPLTKLPGGQPFVRALVRAQERRRLTRRDRAVLAVIIFSPERIVSQAGVAGLNEVYLHIAQRLQRQVGIMNPVGRYWDRCFVALVETIHSPAALRTLGLRVASSLRHPMQVNALDGHSIQVKCEIGVGVVHMDRQPEAVEDLLHQSQRLAEAARHMPSRAAMRDPVSGEAVPVEHAQIGGRRRARSGHVPHAAPHVTGAMHHANGHAARPRA